jgi:hypothetical protein
MRYHPKIKDDCPGIYVRKRKPYTFHVKKLKKINDKEMLSLGILIGGMVVGIMWLISL